MNERLWSRPTTEAKEVHYIVESRERSCLQLLARTFVIKHVEGKDDSDSGEVFLASTKLDKVIGEDVT